MRWMFLVAVALPAMASAQQQTAAPPAAPAPQQPPAAQDPVSDEPDIIVRGTRGLPGAVIGDIPPEEQLGPADIRSYGVNSVAELLTELAPQTRSGRGQGDRHQEHPTHIRLRCCERTPLGGECRTSVPERLGSAA